MHSLRRHFACALVALPALILAGCITIRTPDGHTLTSLTGPGGVRKMLGEPDLIQECAYHDPLPGIATSYTYLDRGYSVHLANGRAVSVVVIPDVQRGDFEQLARAYKEKTAGREEPRPK